jgi:hypothetical protein
MFDTSLVSFSRSYLSFSSLVGALAGCLAVPLCCWGDAVTTLLVVVPLDEKLGLNSSAGWKSTECSCSSVSR